MNFEPRNRREPERLSEPEETREPCGVSEPFGAREPKQRSVWFSRWQSKLAAKSRKALRLIHGAAQIAKICERTTATERASRAERTSQGERAKS